jgi:hypothetical protein
LRLDGKQHREMACKPRLRGFLLMLCFIALTMAFMTVLGLWVPSLRYRPLGARSAYVGMLYVYRSGDNVRIEPDPLSYEPANVVLMVNGGVGFEGRFQTYRRRFTLQWSMVHGDAALIDERAVQAISEWVSARPEAKTLGASWVDRPLRYTRVDTGAKIIDLIKIAGIWIIVSAVAAGTMRALAMLWRAVRSRFPAADYPCPNCGFELTGLAESGCPECGWLRAGTRDAGGA